MYWTKDEFTKRNENWYSGCSPYFPIYTFYFRNFVISKPKDCGFIGQESSTVVKILIIAKEVLIIVWKEAFY